MRTRYWMPLVRTGSEPPIAVAPGGTAPCNTGLCTTSAPPATLKPHTGELGLDVRTTSKKEMAPTVQTKLGTPGVELLPTTRLDVVVPLPGSGGINSLPSLRQPLKSAAERRPHDFAVAVHHRRCCLIVVWLPRGAGGGGGGRRGGPGGRARAK